MSKRIDLIGNALKEALPVAEPLGGEADPLAGARAGQGHHVLSSEEGNILCSSLLLRHSRLARLSETV